MSYILEMDKIIKEFPGVKALDQVSFNVKKGEVHALCGENGAGKSTLMKILSGLYPTGTYAGDIRVNGEKKEFLSIENSEEAGIAIIYQELALIPQMSVAENLFLGNEPLKHGYIDSNKLYKDSIYWLEKVGLDIKPNAKISSLGIGQQQLIEIAKALAKKADILILDEPTAALTDSEVAILMNILERLRQDGVTCIYISHKLGEVFKIADTITVLRDGRTVGTNAASELNEDKVISMMVGRELTERFPEVEFSPGEIILKVENFSVYDRNNGKKRVVDNVSFNVRKGEIVGIAGLMGAGRTELVSSLFGGYTGKKTGEVFIDGKKVNIKSTKDAIEEGLSLVTEDRKGQGLIFNLDIKQNMTLSFLSWLSPKGIINKNEEIKLSQKYVDELKIKTPSLETLVGTLSGGNQQKVVLGKCLMTNPKVLFLDEPTRGIDVGAKFEIYSIMKQLVAQGVAIVMVSSELPEILGMSNRILVMSEGKITAEFSQHEATQEQVMLAATGGNKRGA